MWGQGGTLGSWARTCWWSGDGPPLGWVCYPISMSIHISWWLWDWFVSSYRVTAMHKSNFHSSTYYWLCPACFSVLHKDNVNIRIFWFKEVKFDRYILNGLPIMMVMGAKKKQKSKTTPIMSHTWIMALLHSRVGLRGYVSPKTDIMRIRRPLTTIAFFWRSTPLTSMDKLVGSYLPPPRAST